MNALTLGLLLTAAPTPPAAPAKPLTLPEALSLALTTNPRLEVARAGTNAAKAQYRQARAQGMPNVELDVNGRFQGPEVSLAPPKLPPGVKLGFPSGSFQPDRALEPGLNITAPIYTGGRVSSAKRAARSAVGAALLREQAEAQSLVLDVTSAYLDTLEAREQADLAAALRTLNTERLSVARVKQRAGTAIPLEVSQAEADLAASVQLEIEASARVGQTGAALNALIGRGVREPLVLEPVVTPAAAAAGKPLTPEELEKLGLDRPELRAVREDIKRARAQVDQARAQRRPLVQFKTNLLGRLPETILGNFAWSLGASLVQSIFDGGKTRAQVEAARAELARTQATAGQDAREVAREVEQTRLALDAAEKREAAETARVAAAKEAVGVAVTRLRAGTVPPVEVTEARTTLTRAETDLLNARFEAARARVRLAYVTGMAFPEQVVPVAGPSK
jgi:outer membrane protein TolC